MPLKSISEIADFLGKARETVTKAVKAAGMTPIVEGRSHLYESREVAPLLFDALNPDELDLSKERARLAHHQANKTSLEEDTLRKRLLAADEVAQTWTEMVGAARAKLLAMPQRIAQIAIAGNTIREIEESVRNEVYGALSELAGDTQAGHASVDAAAPIDGGGMGRAKGEGRGRIKSGCHPLVKISHPSPPSFLFLFLLFPPSPSPATDDVQTPLALGWRVPFSFKNKSCFS